MIGEIATIVLLAACLLVILGAAGMLFYTFVYDPLEQIDDEPPDADPYDRARLDLARRIGERR